MTTFSYERFKEFITSNVEHFKRVAPVLMEKALARADAHIAKYPTREDFARGARERAINDLESWKKNETDVKILVTYIAETRNAQLGHEMASAGFYFANVVEEEVCRTRAILTPARLDQLIAMYERTLNLIYNDHHGVGRRGDGIEIINPNAV